MATVRMPSDQQWIERQRKRPIEFRQLGRGRSETKVREHREEDLRIYNEIRLSESPDLDQYEASALLVTLPAPNRFQERREDGYLVKIETVAGVFDPVPQGPSGEGLADLHRNPLLRDQRAQHDRYLRQPFCGREPVRRLCPAAPFRSDYLGKRRPVL